MALLQVFVLSYRFDPKDMNKAVLIMGDSGGGLVVMEFFSAASNLFGIPTSKQGLCMARYSTKVWVIY